MPDIVANTIQLHVVAFDKKRKVPGFLVLQRAKNSKIYPLIWQVITGKIEKNETALTAAIRELKEETNLEPLKMWTLPYVTTFFEVKKDIIHTAPVFGVLVDLKNKIILSYEHRNFEWLNFDDCVERLYLPTHKEGTRVFKEIILDNKELDLFNIINFNHTHPKTKGGI